MEFKKGMVIQPRICRIAGAFLLLAMLPVVGLAGELSDCAQRNVSFDGSTPLSFYRVTGSPDAKLDIHPQYPEICATGKGGCEQTHSYLITGNDVAVGNVCGAWSYIQYVGTSQVTEGWVENARLQFLGTVQNTEGYLRAAFGTGVPPGPLPPPFRETKGQGTPVCEAYLQRLNSTNYTPLHSSPIPAYAEMPESDSIPGFTSLHRVMLEPNAVIQLSGVLARWWLQINPRLSADWDATPQMAKSSLIAAWRYAPPLDINNDGKPEDLVVWRGYGLDAGAARCGQPFNQSYSWGYRCRQMPLVMTSDSHIDQAMTAEIFGRVKGDSSDADNAKKMKHPFIPVGYFIAPFEYQGTTYFSAFFDDHGDFEGKRQGSRELWNTLGVLERKKGSTREVCEYRLQGDDYPQADTGLED